MSKRLVGGYVAALGVAAYYGRDRYGFPFAAVSRGANRLVWGRELRVTLGSWPVFQLTTQSACFHRLWITLA